MKTLQEHVVSQFDKNHDAIVSLLSEWSLLCSIANRSKDIDCKTSINLVTNHIIFRLLPLIGLDADRPWASLAEIEKRISSKYYGEQRSSMPSTSNQEIARLAKSLRLSEKSLHEAQLRIESLEKKRSLFGFQNK